jgi:hypothetical protein
MTDGATARAYGPLSAKILEYDRIVSRLVRKAKEPGFKRADWAPLAELIAVHEFERIGIWREVMNWEQYEDFLTNWAALKGFETSLRRITEAPPLVFFEVEERHFKDDQLTIINSLSVFEFNDAGRIRHVDVYLQGQLYAPGALPDYAIPK